VVRTPKKYATFAVENEMADFCIRMLGCVLAADRCF